jgi:hypothetical protein
MALRHLISIICGFLITVVVYGVIASAVFYSTFTLEPETLSHYEGSTALYFYSALFISVSTIAIIILLIRRKKNFTARGIKIALLIALFATVNLGWKYFENFHTYESFDSNIWKHSDPKPFKMAKTLVKKHLLKGLTKQQLADKLGNIDSGNYSNNDNMIIFKTDEHWVLYIELKNDSVSRAFLMQPTFTN